MHRPKCAGRSRIWGRASHEEPRRGQRRRGRESGVLMDKTASHRRQKTVGLEFSHHTASRGGRSEVLAEVLMGEESRTFQREMD